jgi:diphthamide synthase (EF-2-diphthine--ammonia ligase)
VAGEGGEYESMVLYGPHMKKRIRVDFEKDWRVYSGKIIVKRAWLE